MWCSCSMASKKVEQERVIFLNNGAQLLQELITLCDGKCSPIRFFSQKELEKMTDNYSGNNMFMWDATYKLYNGSLDDRSITVKKGTQDDCQQDVTDFIKEIAITSYVNHKNVLKLLGCCIESRLPLQVYEFVSNGSLSNHIYETESNFSSNSQLLPWDSRLRVAIEIADAVTYLHTATLRPIIHANIQLRTILLDHNYVAKLSDFGFCTVIPLGETELEVDVIRGTTGYLPPEYFKGQVTEKTDVYNFGVILLELLTGQKPFHVRPSGVHIHLLDLGSFMEDNSLHEIVAPAILKEQRPIEQQLQAFADLALRCAKVSAEERPTMMEVAKELRRIHSTEKLKHNLF